MVLCILLLSTTCLQGLFEGLKAYRTQDGNIVLFRPNENALRMRTGAERMCMAAPTVEQFLEAVKETVLANERWVLCNFSLRYETCNFRVLVFDLFFQRI